MKSKLANYNYGECEFCDATLQEKLTTQDFWIRGKLIVVEDVPADVCPRCGEKVVNAVVGRRLADLLQDDKQIAKASRISVPALAYRSK